MFFFFGGGGEEGIDTTMHTMATPLLFPRNLLDGPTKSCRFSLSLGGLSILSFKAMENILMHVPDT